MPEISIAAYVPASPAQVFSQVTAYPAQGTPEPRLLQEKYGSLLSQEGNSYIFQENTEAANRWRYTFEPPGRRTAEAIQSTWSDRTDTFEASGEGTLWTITWQPPGRGAPFLLRWLFFRLKDRKRVYDQIARPVVEHFQQQGYY